MSAPTTPKRTLPAGIDLQKETVITGRVVDDSGHTVAGASVRLLDDTEEFTAELIASPTGDFRFFAAPGTWTVRALSGSAREMSPSPRPEPESTRSTSRSPDDPAGR